ncbi:restriction endonuclease subunit S (plasmid) [Bacillus thuringiensis]|nr:restriction endonuclease subunit S [Bacillus thuringiensis]
MRIRRLCMSGKVKSVKLEEEIELLYGKALTKKQRVHGNIPVYGSNGIIDYHNKGYFIGPGIILGRKGTVGSVEYSIGDFWAIDTTYVVRTRSTEDDTMYWYYFLKMLNLNRMNTHSVIPTLNRDNVYSLTVNVLESYSERRKVANILSSIDEKIETNNQINKKLETMAQTIFKHWFVDFEFPNENGDPYKSSGGSMFESKLGMIPKGWEVKELREVVEFEYGKPLKRENRKEGVIPVYGSNGIIGFHNESIVKGPGIVIGRKGNPGTVIYVHEDFYPIDTTFYVVSKSRFEDFGFIYMLLKNQNLTTLSTGSVVPGLNRNLLYMNKMLFPNKSMIVKFEGVIKSINNMIYHNYSQNKHLMSIRDTLLPKLVSGEIRVPVK